jgi:transposase InsO family protein
MDSHERCPNRAARSKADGAKVGRGPVVWHGRGAQGLRDRSARPLRSPRRLPPETTAQIEALRRQRRSGPAIARELGLAGATVGLVLRRLGLDSLKALDPKPEIIRDEREHPGKLIRIDIKTPGRIDGVGHRITGDRHGQSGKRGNGSEYLHVAIDAAIVWFRAHGVAVQRIMTDHGSAYRSAAFAKAIATHGLKHRRTRPSTPKTNGKAERFIQTSIREWFYGTPLRTSAERTRAMHPWLHADNTAQPRSALKGKPPISRIARGNALGNDIQIAVAPG